MANPPPPKMPSPPKKGPAPWRLKVGKVTPWLFLLYVIGGMVQVYLAGYGIENLGAQPEAFDWHGFLGAVVLHGITLLIVVFGFLGADWRAGLGGIVLFLLVGVQFPLLEGLDARVLALHAFNGVLTIVVAMAFLARRLPWKRAQVAPPAAAARPAAKPAAATPTPMRAVPATPRPPQPPAR